MCVREGGGGVSGNSVGVWNPTKPIAKQFRDAGDCGTYGFQNFNKNTIFTSSRSGFYHLHHHLKRKLGVLVSLIKELNVPLVSTARSNWLYLYQKLNKQFNFSLLQYLNWLKTPDIHRSPMKQLLHLFINISLSNGLWPILQSIGSNDSNNAYIKTYTLLSSGATSSNKP